MKRSIIFIALSLTFISISANAAQIIKKDDESNYNKIGVISVSGVHGSMDDAIRKLSNKADKKGGVYMNITSLGTSGDSSLFHGTANIFK